MKLKYNVTGAERKALVTALSEITNATPQYKGAPSFAYEVDRYTVDKNGTVSGGDSDTLLAALAEKGFDAENTPAVNTLAINMPRSGFNEATLENLRRLVASKSTLIRHAIGAESLPIEVTDETVRFPWFTLSDDATANKAYTHFIAALGNMARTQQRITATEKPVDNEKYAFRCFLLRLGFIGADYKDERKILLARLLFQSTLPLQGATHDKSRRNQLDGISIHAPFAGSDVADAMALQGGGHFNPRSLCRERLYLGECL